MPPSSVPSQAVAPRRSTRSKGNTSHFSDVVRPSSPPKNTDNFPKSRDVLETFVRSQGSNIDEKFLSRHLRSPPKRLTLKQPQDNSQISAIVKAGKLSCKIYKPLAKLLTNFSRRIHEDPKRIKNRYMPTHPYIFLDHHHNAPMYHPYNVQNAPDLLAVEEGKCDYEHITGKDRGDYRGVHYNRVVSVIECKPKRGNGWAQASTYYWQLMEARPDMPGVYGLSAKPQGYQVLWSDACGTVISPITEWNKLDLLEGYVYSLYFPPKGHFLFDPTITSSTGDSDMKQPMWTIKSPRGVEYSRCLKLFTGSSWGRRTSIWRQQGQALVIKDSFREDVRRFEESKFLQDIHDSGIFPGVVRTLELPKLDPKSTAIATALRVDRVARKRTRLILGSYGEPLENARSVKDILMAVYDILEVHRVLVMDRHILHRDISKYNILMYPKHHPRTGKGKSLAADRPKFIKQVLGKEDEINGEDQSMGLLIDFDNSAKMETCSGRTEKKLGFITGTPRYIARSVASGLVLGPAKEYTDYPRMPELEDEAKRLYEDSYGPVTYAEYCDKNDTAHGRTIPKTFSKMEFGHRPDHDVESIYWVLLATLSRAEPQDPLRNPNLTIYWKLYDTFLMHTIERGVPWDTRSPLLGLEDETIRLALDPRLSSLAPMLTEMARQVRPEYAYLQPSQEHLHEAFRRLLLRQIVEMGDEVIPLKAGYVRSLKHEYYRGSAAEDDSAVQRNVKAGSLTYAEVAPQRPLTSDYSIL